VNGVAKPHTLQAPSVWPHILCCVSSMGETGSCTVP